MILDVLLPAFDDKAQTGTLVQWCKGVGDRVAAGEPLLEVMTEKVNIEIPSPCAGTIIELIADVDGEVKVGDLIARVKQ